MDTNSEPLVADPVTANAVLIGVFSFFGILLNIVPLIMLCRVRSLPAITLIANNMLFTFWTFINVCIWPTDNFTIWWGGVGLCDIEATLRTPMYTLLALAVCVLTRDLSRAVDVDHPRLFETPAQRRRRHVVDVLCMFALPILQLPLHYVVQYNRYSIMPVYGCVDLLDDSWPRVVLLSMWPLLIGILNCYYSILTIVRLRQHRGRLSSTLSRTSSGLDSRKFLKLFALTTVLLAIYLPVLGYFFYTNVREPFIPYSWNRIHNPLVWNQVLYLHSSDFPDVQYWPWIPIVFAFILFLWYGLAHEAIECYRRSLLFCGFAKIWPSLHEPHQPRRANRSNLSSRGSWVSKLDIFEKTAAYLDSSKNQKRQVPKATSSLSCSENPTGSNRKQSKSSTTTTSTDDTITPVTPSSHHFEKPVMPSVQEVESGDSVSSLPPTNRGLFSAFRTHINVPFPLFTPLFTTASTKSAPSTQARRTSTNSADLEKQAYINDPTQHAITTSSPVETSIWSGDDDEELDPNAPKMGTRAYRERERREMLKRESREKNEARVIRDEVVVDMGLLIQGEVEHGGVEVKREFVRMEEGA